MKVVFRIFNIITPVLTGVLFLFSNAYAWYDYPHNIREYLSVSLTGGYSGYTKNYEGYFKADDGGIYYGTEISLGDKRMILSRAGIYGDGNSDSLQRSYFMELGLPFTFDFLSYQTRMFLYYEGLHQDYKLEALKSANFVDGVVNKGDRVNFNNKQFTLALLFDTPITENDSFDSLSRFGVYYSEVTTTKVVYLKSSDSDYFVNFLEQYGGFMYSLKKPAFTDNFIVGLDLRLGLGTQKLKNNIYGLSSGDFSDSSLIFRFLGSLMVAYNIDITDYILIKLHGGYQYNVSTPLVPYKSGYSTVYSSNNGVYTFGADLTFYF